MNGKLHHRVLVSALCACALVGSAAANAQSKVSLYGQLDVWAGKTRPIGQANRSWVEGAGGMQTSYLGIKGTEALGDDLKAIFALEAFYRADTGSGGRFNGDPMFARSAYVGLQGTFGSVKLGRNTTPYWISTILFNPFAGSFAFSPAVFQSYCANGSVSAPLIGDSGWSNSILYASPTFAGLTGSALYASGETQGGAGKNKFGANLLYSNGPFAATLAFQQVDFSTVPGDLGPNFNKQRAALAGATYDFKVVKLFGQYQHLGNDLQTGDVGRNSGQLGVSIPLGKGAVLASYAHMKTHGATDTKRNTWALGYDYYLSKRTDVYTAYFRDVADGNSAGDTFGVGLRHNF